MLMGCCWLNIVGGNSNEKRKNSRCIDFDCYNCNCGWNDIDNMNGLRKATSFFDFINVELYPNPERYSVKTGMKYWIWSELKQELQEYEINEVVKYSDLEPYVEKGLIYIE